MAKTSGRKRTERKKPTRKKAKRKATAKRTAPEAQAPRPLRVGFIGAGPRALGSHYPSIRDLPDATLCAIAELDDERLKNAAEQFGASALYHDYRRMIEAERPDVVYAIMPPHHLFDVAATVLESGTHLVVEKPPAVTTEQTRQLALLARRRGVLTAVTFQRRYSPVLRAGLDACQARGPVHTAVATFYKHALGAGPYYRGAMDILRCDAIHAVDTLRALCGGGVLAVASDVRRLLADHVTAHLALVRFSTGATGVLLTNWMTGRRFFTAEIHGPGISCFADPEEGGRLYADGHAEPLRTLDPFELAGSTEPHRAFGPYDMNRHILDSIRRGVPPDTSLDDAVKTMELADAIEQAQIQ